MKCSDVDSIIDEHRGRCLAPAESAAVQAHLERCVRCSSAWLTNELLVSERWPVVPGSFDAMVRAVGIRAADETGRRASAWPVWAGLVAVVLMAALLLSALRPADVPWPAERAPALVEGRDYRVLLPRTSTVPAADDVVEVLQFFAYDCRPCFALEQQMADWSARRRDGIALIRAPVQWNARAERLALAYYAAEALGRGADLHSALFAEVQVNGNLLDTDDAIAAVFARFDVDRPTFDQVFGSRAVTNEAEQSVALAAAYGIVAVPSIVVGGAFVTTGSMAGSADRLIEIVDRLVECVAETQRTARPTVLHC